MLLCMRSSESTCQFFKLSRPDFELMTMYAVDEEEGKLQEEKESHWLKAQ